MPLVETNTRQKVTLAMKRRQQKRRSGPGDIHQPSSHHTVLNLKNMTPEEKDQFEQEHQEMILAGLWAQGKRTRRTRRNGENNQAGGRIGSVASIKTLSMNSLPQENDYSRSSRGSRGSDFRETASYPESLPDDDLMNDLSDDNATNDNGDDADQDDEHNQMGDNSAEETQTEKVFTKEEQSFLKSRRTLRMIQRSTKKLLAKLQDDSE